MAKNPNEIPPWLLDDDDDGDEKPSSPPPAKPTQGAPSTPPSSPPPRPKGPAPWLAMEEGGDEDMLEKGGLSEDWLASGAFLVEKVDTELTYDEWIARQQEQRREKSIEEEVPEFHDTGELPDLDAPAPPPTGTGTLPDWFLGMETLKPEEEPEWMRTGDKFTSDPPVPTVPQEDVPVWMRSTGTFDASPIPEFSGFTPQMDDDEPHDEIASFFDSLGAGDAPADDIPEDEDELPPEFMFGDQPITSRAADSKDGVTGILGEDEPEPPLRPSAAASVDWALPDADQNVMDDDWSSVTDEIAAAAAAAGYDTLPDRPTTYPDHELGTLDLPPDSEVDSLIAAGPDESWFMESDDEPAQYSDEDEPDSGDRPQGFGTGTLMRLDEFFGDVAAQRQSAPQEADGIDEPDLEWFLNQQEIPATGSLPPHPADADAAEADAAPEPPAQDSAETLTWLSELNTIVQSVQRGDQDVTAFDSTEDLFAPVSDPLPPSPSFEEINQRTAADIGLEEFDFGITSEDIAQMEASTPSQPIAEPISEFDWEMAAPVPDEPEGIDAAQPWLNAFDTETVEAANKAEAERGDEPEEPLIPRLNEVVPPTPGLTGMLTRFAESDEAPEPETPPMPAQRKPTSLDSDFESPPVVFDLFDSDEMPAAADFTFEDASPASGGLPPLDVPDLFGEDALDPDVRAALYGGAPSAGSTPQDDEDFFSLITQDPDVNLLDGEQEDDQAFTFETDEPQFPSELFAAVPSQPDDDFDLNDLYITDDPTPRDADTILSGFAREDAEIADDTLRDLFDVEALSQSESAPSHMDALPADLEPGDEFASMLAGLSAEPEPEMPSFAWENLPDEDDDRPTVDDLPRQQNLDVANITTTSEDVNMRRTDEAEPLFGSAEDDELFSGLTFTDSSEVSIMPGQTLNPSDTLDLSEDVDASDTLDLGAELELADAPPAPVAADDSDFFGSLALDEEPPSAEAGDFFGTFELDDSPEPAPISGDADFFSSLSFQGESEQPSFDAPAASGASPSDSDFFSSLQFGGGQPSDEASGAQADELPEFDPVPTPPPAQELPDWMRDEPAPEFGGNADFEPPPDDDFFSGIEEVRKTEELAAAPVFSSLEDYLASLNPGEAPELTPETEALLRDSNVDLDRLFTEGLPTKTEALPQSGDLQPGMGADWLDDVQKQTRDVSPSAIVRQLKDKPETDLPDRLKKLRQREKEVADKSDTGEFPKRGRRRRAEQPSAEESSIPGELSAVPIIAPGAATFAQTVTVKPEQQAKVDLLRAIAPMTARTAKPGEARLSAIDLTYDTPFLRDLEDNENALVRQSRTDDLPKISDAPAAVPVKARAKRRRTPRRYDRLFVSLLILLAMLAPIFIVELNFAAPPGSLLDASGAPASAVYRYVDSIAPGDYVLIAVEYGPASAGELDRMTDAVLRHILLRGGRPVIISANPFGSVRTNNLIEAINDDAAFLNRINAPGGVLLPNLDYYVIRYLAGGVIGVRSFGEDPSAVLATNITGGATGLQARVLNDFALIMVIADSPDDLRMYAEQIAPLTRAPFTAAVGYSAAPVAETYTGSASVFDGLLIGGIDAAAYQAALANVGALERGERLPTPTPTTAPPAGSAAGEAPPAAGETPLTGQTALVLGSRTVNVRAGAGTEFAVVTTVAPGAVLQVLGFNADQTWVNVRVDDGREGWVSALLIELSDAGSMSPASKAFARQDAVPTRTPRPTLDSGDVTAEASAEATSESTEESAVVQPTTAPTAEPFVMPSLTLDTEVTPDELEARRYSVFYMGIVASSVVIAFGAVFNIVRGLRKRGRNS